DCAEQAMPQNPDEFLCALSLENCISRLKEIPHQYASVKLSVEIEQNEKDSCRFILLAKSVSRGTMNMSAFGHIKRIAGKASLITIEDIVPSKLGYIAQYLLLTSPIILLIAFISGKIDVLLGIPFVTSTSLIALIGKHYDRNEMLRILHRTFR